MKHLIFVVPNSNPAILRRKLDEESSTEIQPASKWQDGEFNITLGEIFGLWVCLFLIVLIIQLGFSNNEQKY